MTQTRVVAPVAAVLVCLAGAAGPARSQVAAMGTAATPSLDREIRDRLGVTAYSIQHFVAPPDPSAGFAAEFVGAGRTLTADFSPDPVNTPDCTMVVYDGPGSPREVPAPPSCTYRGSIRGYPGSICSGSLIGNRLTAVLLLGPGLGSFSVLPLAEVSAGADPTLHIVSSNDDLIAGPWTCGVPSGRFGPPLTGTGEGGAGGEGSGHTDTSLVCELACEADYPYFQLVGSNASGVAQDISTVIANVTSYYILSGTGVRFRIVRYVIRATPQSNPGLYNVTDAQTLLSNFRAVWNNLAAGIPRDTAHMFTGQDLNGTTIGLAYLNAVCLTQWAYGLSQSRFSLQPGRRAALTAHELGHNFSASHCDNQTVCTPCQLMEARQGNTTAELTRFGCSTSVIQSFAAGRTCLSGGPAQTPPPSCPADFDLDGRLTGLDFAAFTSAFAGAEARADMDGDGRFTVNDFVEFMNAYAGGCR